MKARRKWTILFILLLMLGLSLLAYPSFSSLYNQGRQSRVISGYQETLQREKDPYRQELALAEAYNEDLSLQGSDFSLSLAEKGDYTRLLGAEGTALGYVEIPALELQLPIYLGTGESVLQAGVGVLEGSSLPIGGESTHSVLTGHRGLPTATLFTHLDQLEAGSQFTLHVLGRTLRYEVERVLVVEPEDMEALYIQEGEDLCTLVTCTPYGINSHRMLVQGRRVEDGAEILSQQIRSDGVRIPWSQVAPALGAAFFILAAMAMGLVRIGKQGILFLEALFDKRKGGNGNEKTA